MSVPQRCVGPPVTSPQRLLNAPWMQDTKDMGLRWTCECAGTRTTQEDMWMWLKKQTKQNKNRNFLHPTADGVQGSSCTRCSRALLPSGTGNRCWCCAWSWQEITTSRLQSGRTAQTPWKIWSATFANVTNRYKDSWQADESNSPCLLSADLSDVGGGPKAAIHSQGRSQPLFLFPVCCGRGARVQSLQAVQGERLIPATMSCSRHRRAKSRVAWTWH